jgi:hypothetical protein
VWTGLDWNGLDWTGQALAESTGGPVMRFADTVMAIRVSLGQPSNSRFSKKTSHNGITLHCSVNKLEEMPPRSIR